MEYFRANFIPIMHIVQIDRFTVEFPFEPYECQIKFMEKVLEALWTVYFIIDN